MLSQNEIKEILALCENSQYAGISKFIGVRGGNIKQILNIMFDIVIIIIYHKNNRSYNTKLLTGNCYATLHAIL